ncbi:MAG: hypothetical protein ACLQU2_31130 [Candidatus Binataceae bacterium]
MVALLVPAKFVAVQQNRPNRIANITAAFGAGDLSACQFDQSERVASTRPEEGHVEMEIVPILFKQTANERAITKLAFALATEKDRSALPQ